MAKKITSPAFTRKEKTTEQTLDELLNRGKKSSSRYLFGESADPVTLASTPLTAAATGNVQGANTTATGYTPSTNSTYSIYDYPSQHSDFDQNTAGNWLEEFNRLNSGYQPSQEANYETPQGFQQVMSDLVTIPVAQTPDGGTLYSNGMVQYVDGTTRQVSGADVPRVIRRFDDGSVLLANGKFINASSRIGRAYQGVSGLLDVLNLSGQTITQQYGNYNPGLGYSSGFHSGLDVRTRDLPQDFYFTLPFDAKVVDVKYDDGTRWGTNSGHQGYGNSILLELPNGSMIRLSHLSDMVNIQPGTTISSFDYIGTPGSTGNSTAEHLDLEYYDSNGRKISDPSKFYFDAMQHIDNDKIQQASSDASNLSTADQKWLQAQQAAIERGENITLDPKQFEEGYQARQPQQQTTLGAYDGVLPTQPKPEETPITQALQPMSSQRQAAGEAVNTAGKALADRGILSGLGNTPEGFVGAGELVAGDYPAAGRELSATIERSNPSKRIDVGLSELLRGDVSGAKDVLTDTLSRGATKVTDTLKGLNIFNPPQVQASSLSDSNYQAGSGVKQAIQQAQNYYQGDYKPSLTTPFAKKVVGESPSGTQELAKSSYSPSAQVTAVSNPQDPFFKAGGATRYAGMINADSNYRGALTPALFTNAFYENAQNVRDVFGGSAYEQEAATKARQAEASKYNFNPDQWAYQNKEDYRREVDSYNQKLNAYLNQIESSAKGQGGDYATLARASSSLKTPFAQKEEIAGNAFYSPSRKNQTYADLAGTKSTFDAFKPVTTSNQTIFSSNRPDYANYVSLSDYLRQGKTAQQYYAETGQQSYLDQLGRSGISVDTQGNLSGVGINNGSQQGDVSWGQVSVPTLGGQSIPTTRYTNPSSTVARARQDAAIAWNPNTQQKSISQRAREEAARKWRVY